MNNATFESISSSFQDGVYTSLIDAGLEPGVAYELSRNTADFLDVDEYADALETDNDTLA